MFKIIILLAMIFACLSFAVIDFVDCLESSKDEFKYTSKGKRDPFVPLIGQDRAKGNGLDGITSIQDVFLEGIAVGPKGRNIAIMNGQMVKDGDKFGNLLIKKIDQRSVNLSLEGKDYTLQLQEVQGAGQGVNK